MKKFVNFLILFALYVTVNYINFDWSNVTKLGKIYYYPAWFMRSVLVWLFCPIFIPEYFFKQSSIYKQYKKLQKDPAFQAQMLKSMNMFNF
jgi:hypothetical protein